MWTQNDIKLIRDKLNELQSMRHTNLNIKEMKERFNEYKKNQEIK